MDVYDIAASALSAQRLRLDTISSNLANANTTRKADGTKGAYHRKQLAFAPLIEDASQRMGGFGSKDFASSIPMKPSPAGISIGPDGQPILRAGITENNYQGAGVQVTSIEDDTTTPMPMIYDPSHPDANEKGYVEMPNVNVVKEMVDMISANRAYEANVTSVQSAKGMSRAALEI